MKINQAYIVRDVFGKMILIPFLNTKLGNKPIYVNDTGRSVIQMLDRSDDAKELCDNVAQHYSIDDSTNEYKLIQDFIQNLIELEIIEQE